MGFLPLGERKKWKGKYRFNLARKEWQAPPNRAGREAWAKLSPFSFPPSPIQIFNFTVLVRD
jgi:hypothetical protein